MVLCACVILLLSLFFVLYRGKSLGVSGAEVAIFMIINSLSLLIDVQIR